METRHYHIPALQSARGLAAAIVLLLHSSFLFATSATFHYWVEIALNAHAAVVFFFVLSGYVLSRSLSGAQSGLQWIRYYVARVFRIYPALWLACALAAAYLLLLHFYLPTEHASLWYAQYYSHGPRPLDFLRNATIPNAEPLLVPPSWSIYVELIGSALLPVFILLIRRGFGLPLFAVTVAAAFASDHWHAIWPVEYLPAFVVGALAFRHAEQFKAVFGHLAWLIASLLLLLFFRRINPAWRFDADYGALIPGLVEGVAGGGLIVGLAARPAAALGGKALVWLGDISYSVYLLHFIIMSALAKLIGASSLPGDGRALALMTSTLAVTLLIADPLYRLVEKPGMAIGRHLMGMLKSRIEAAPA